MLLRLVGGKGGKAAQGLRRVAVFGRREGGERRDVRMSERERIGSSRSYLTDTTDLYFSPPFILLFVFGHFAVYDPERCTGIERPPMEER